MGKMIDPASKSEPDACGTGKSASPTMVFQKKNIYFLLQRRCFAL
jgi:hypothetical protein